MLRGEGPEEEISFKEREMDGGDVGLMMLLREVYDL